MAHDSSETGNDPNGRQELIRKARELQQQIDELKQIIHQSHQQKLRPKYIEELNEMLARMIKEQLDLFN